jgi:DNA-binding protein HU-beta
VHVNKSQLIDAIAERYEGNRKMAAHALESVLDTITREVAKGEKVAITGFGSFERAVRNSRWVRNPQTGERMQTAQKFVPKFTPGQDLRNIIAGVKQLTELTAENMPKPPAPVRAAAAAATAPARAAAELAGKMAKPVLDRAAGGAPAKRPATVVPSEPTTVKKTAAGKKTAAPKAGSAATAAKKTTAKKTTAAAAKQAPAKKTATKQTATKQTAAKKSSTKKTTAAKQAPAKKTTAKKTTAKKSAPKKSAPTKTTAKKTTSNG